MIRIDPDTFYSRADLAELLKPFGLDADTFVARIRPRRVFKAFLVGQDILVALATAPALAMRGKAAALPAARRGRRNGGRGTARRVETPALDALRAELKG